MWGYRWWAVMAVVVSMSVAVWSSCRLASTHSLLALDRGLPRPVATELDYLRLVYPREMARCRLSPAELSSKIAQATKQEEARVSRSDSESQKKKWELAKTCLGENPDAPLMFHDGRHRMPRGFRLEVEHVMDTRPFPAIETAKLVLRIVSPGYTFEIMDLGTRKVPDYRISPRGTVIPVEVE